MSEELEPCPFCGNPVDVVDSNTWKRFFVHCARCVVTFPINPERWNNRFWWQEIDKMKAKYEEAKRNAVDAERRFQAAREVARLMSYYHDGPLDFQKLSFRQVNEEIEKRLAEQKGMK